MDVTATTYTNPLRDALLVARDAEADARAAYLATPTGPGFGAALVVLLAACRVTEAAEVAWRAAKDIALDALMAELFGPATA